MKEQGFDYEVSSWNSFFTRAGSPPTAIALLNKHVVEILQMRAQVLQVGFGLRAVVHGRPS